MNPEQQIPTRSAYEIAFDIMEDIIPEHVADPASNRAKLEGGSYYIRLNGDENQGGTPDVGDRILLQRSDTWITEGITVYREENVRYPVSDDGNDTTIVRSYLLKPEGAFVLGTSIVKGANGIVGHGRVLTPLSLALESDLAAAISTAYPSCFADQA